MSNFPNTRLLLCILLIVLSSLHCGLGATFLADPSISELDDLISELSISPYALHQACKNDDTQKIKELLKLGNASINLADECGWTPLLYACKCSSSSVKRLIAAKANVNQADDAGLTPLFWAIFTAHKQNTLLLLNSNASVDLIKTQPEILHTACLIGVPSLVSQLVKYKYQLNVRRTYDGATPLHCVANQQFSNSKLNDGLENHALDLLVQQEAQINAATALLLNRADCNLLDNNKETPLMIAIKRGLDGLVQCLIQNGADVNKSGLNRVTPLSLAISCNLPKIVEYLLIRGASVNESALNGNSPLHDASESGFADIAKLLIKHQANVDHINKDTNTPLIVACKHGHLIVTKRLIKAKACIDWQDERRQLTPLIWATYKNHAPIVKYLLKHGASVNLSTKSDLSPLHHAALTGAANIARLLLEHNADIDQKSNHGKTPLLFMFSALSNEQFALRPKHTCLESSSNDKWNETVGVLLQNKANISAQDHYENSPMLLAAKHGHFDILRQLFEAKEDPEQDEDTLAILINATCKNQHDLVKYLLEHRASPNLIDDRGCSPIHYACEKGYLDIAKLLIQHDADIHGISSLGYSPLRLLMENARMANYPAVALNSAQELDSRDKIIDLLLNAGLNFNLSKIKMKVVFKILVEMHRIYIYSRLLILKPTLINQQHKMGRTVLHWATILNQGPMVEYLLKVKASPNIADSFGMTAVHYACSLGEESILYALFRKSPDINYSDDKNRTPLHLLISSGRLMKICALNNGDDFNGYPKWIRMIENLLKRGADPNLLDNYELSPLTIPKQKEPLKRHIYTYFLQPTRFDRLSLANKQFLRNLFGFPKEFVTMKNGFFVKLFCASDLAKELLEDMKQSICNLFKNELFETLELFEETLRPIKYRFNASNLFQDTVIIYLLYILKKYLLQRLNLEWIKQYPQEEVPVYKIYKIILKGGNYKDLLFLTNELSEMLAPTDDCIQLIEA